MQFARRLGGRFANVRKLMRMADEYEALEGPDLAGFVTAIRSLGDLSDREGSAATLAEGENVVRVMTIHQAKGLEFPLVFLTGMEEGLFPHRMSAEEPGRLEEERRLCYVGMTRAQRHLYLTHAETRRLHGSETYPRPSRFLREVPEELTSEVRLSGSAPTKYGEVLMSRERPRPSSGSSASSPSPEGSLRLGQQVRHAKFGEGVVLNYEGQGEQARVQISFGRGGSKWLMVAYANLQTV